MDAHPHSHYKYCPRCGTKGQFNDEQLSFSCSACGFQFFLNASAAVSALIFNNKGELLMTHRGVEPALGMLDLPGGFIDPGESAEIALLREIEEELDLVPEMIEYYGSFPNEYQYSGTIVFTVDLVFKCKVTDFSQLKFRDDIAGIQFIHPLLINIEDLPFQSVRNLIKEIQNEYGNSAKAGQA